MGRSRDRPADEPDHSGIPCCTAAWQGTPLPKRRWFEWATIPPSHYCVCEASRRLRGRTVRLTDTGPPQILSLEREFESIHAGEDSDRIAVRVAHGHPSHRGRPPRLGGDRMARCNVATGNVDASSAERFRGALARPAR